MGFQTGTKIDPRLMQADYSGFARAAEIRGQALANLGEQVGGAMKAYAQKKEEKKLNEAAANMVLSYADKNKEAAANMGIVDLDSAKEAVKVLGGGAPTMQVLQQLGQRDQEVSSQAAHQSALAESFAVNTMPGTEGVDYANILPTYISMGGPDPQAVRELIGQTGGTAKQSAFAEKVTALMSAGYDEQAAVAGATTGRLPASLGAQGAGAVGMTETEAVKRVSELKDKGIKATVKLAEGGGFEVQQMVSIPMEEVAPTKGQEVLSGGRAEAVKLWETGERAQAIENLGTYDHVIAQLKSGEVDTRGIASFLPEQLGIRDTVTAFIKPTTQDAYDRLTGVVFQGLKDTLGAQFTAKEAERLVATTFNPKLPEAQNIERLSGLRDVLHQTIQAKDNMLKWIEGGDRGPKPPTASETYKSAVRSLSDAAGASAASVPEGISPAEWSIMSEEDKKLFL